MYTNPITSADQAMLIIANTPSATITQSVMAAGAQLLDITDGTLILDGTGGVFVQPGDGTAGHWLNENDLIALAKIVLSR